MPVVAEVEPENPEETAPPKGWYDYAGGQRFWDGTGWTDHYAPPQPKAPEPINYWRIARAVAVGMVVGWFIIWALAQAYPETFYWPVKFVVEELPEGF